jgi:glycosyltransferase involved in cell wall biosynthesis
MERDNHMRILSVTLNYTDEWGGTTQSVRNFSDALGADVLSFTFESLIPKARHGVNITHIPVPETFLGRHYSLPRLHDLRQARKLASGYDVVFCHMLFRHHNDWVARLGKPYFIVPHGALDPYVFTYRRLEKELWLQTVAGRFFRRAEAVIFATRREQKKAFRGIGSDKGRVIFWPVCGSGHKDFGREELRLRLGIAKGEKMLLFLGRLHEVKRPLETIEAFTMAAQADTHLVIVGPEEQYSIRDLQAAAEQCGARNVHVEGPAFGDEKWTYLSAADGYISLSAKENFSYSAAEAMYAGLPTILSLGNDLAYELSSEECCWRLQTNDREEAAQAIRAFATSTPEVLRQMGERGRRWVQKNASFENFRRQLRELVFSAADRKGPSSTNGDNCKVKKDTRQGYRL